MIDLRVAGFLLALLVGIASWGLTCAAWQFDSVSAGWMPLEARHFDRLTLVALGTGGAHENHRRLGPATAVALGDEIVLVDAGRGVAEALRAASIPPGQPSSVLLTSTLPENTVGLDDLLAAAWLEGRRQPIALVGPPGTAAAAAAAQRMVASGWAARAEALGLEAGAPRFEVTEVDGDGGDAAAVWEHAVAGLSIRAGALPGGPLPALAYRFSADGREAVVSGTGWSPDALVAFAKGAQVWVQPAVAVPSLEEARAVGLDVTPEQLEREAAFDTPLSRVGGLAQRAGVGALVLVRLRPPPVYTLQVTSLVDDSYDGRVWVPEDGDEVTP